MIQGGVTSIDSILSLATGVKLHGQSTKLGGGQGSSLRRSRGGVVIINVHVQHNIIIPLLYYNKYSCSSSLDSWACWKEPGWHQSYCRAPWRIKKHYPSELKSYILNSIQAMFHQSSFTLWKKNMTRARVSSSGGAGGEASPPNSSASPPKFLDRWCHHKKLWVCAKLDVRNHQMLIQEQFNLWVRGYLPPQTKNPRWNPDSTQ